MKSKIHKIKPLHIKLEICTIVTSQKNKIKASEFYFAKTASMSMEEFGKIGKEGES